MEALKKLVHELSEAEGDHTPFLQKINEELLKNYQLSIGDSITILPKEVEIYYVNRKVPNSYVDMNMHCMLNPKTNAEIWNLQSNRFGQLYIHRKGRGGVDVCLSDSSDYALCCTIKAAEVNKEDVWNSLKIRNIILDSMCNRENSSDMTKVIEKFNDNHSTPVLSLREQTITDYVYHMRRKGLHRRDSHVFLHLLSIIDLWNEKFLINKVEKVKVYINAHTEENVLDILRGHGFRYIPSEIRIEYKISNKTKLYE